MTRLAIFFVNHKHKSRYGTAPLPLYGCDFVSLHTNTQIRKRQLFFCAKVFHLRNSLLCICLERKPVLLVNTQIHITKWPDFYLCIFCKILSVAQINDLCGTFICVTNTLAARGLEEAF